MQQLGINSKDMYHAEVRGWPPQNAQAAGKLERLFGVPIDVLLKPVNEIQFV